MKKVTLFLIAILLQSQYAFGDDLRVLCCDGCSAPSQAQCNSLCSDKCGSFVQPDVDIKPMCTGRVTLRSDNITYDKYDASYNSTTNKCEYTKNGIACVSGYYLGKKPGLMAGTLVDACIKCPAATGVTSKDKNTDNISGCYVAKGTVISDETGEYEYTSNCHHSMF